MKRKRTSTVPSKPKKALTNYYLKRYVPLFLALDPLYSSKYLTTSWCLYEAGITHSHILGTLQEEQNGMLIRPEQRLDAVNERYREEIYARSQTAAEWLRRRNYKVGAAGHRSNSFWHELHIDTCVYQPIKFAADHDDSLELLDTRALLEHPDVPKKTRESSDPFLIKIGDKRELRLDGRPIILTRHGTTTRTLGIPGIEWHTGSMSARVRDIEKSLESGQSTLAKHIDDINVALKLHAFEKHYGMDRVFIPIICQSPQAMEAAILYQKEHHGPQPYIGFHWIPDQKREDHYAKPHHYDIHHIYEPDEWTPSEQIHICHRPFKRVGHPDFYLTTFSPNPPPTGTFHGYLRKEKTSTATA